MLLPLCFLLALSQTSAADPLPPAEEVLDALDARCASPEVRRALSGIVLEGRVTVEGLEDTGSFRELYGPGRRTRFEMELPGLGTFVQGCDGEHVWECDPRRGAILGSDDALRQAITRHGIAVGRPWRELYEEARTVGRDTIDGQAVLRIAMTPAQGRPEHWYVDSAENVLVRHVMKRETADGPFDVSTTYSDWRPIEGVEIPFRREVRTRGQVVTRSTDRVRLGVEHEEGTFDVPPAVAAFVQARADPPLEPRLEQRDEQPVLATRTSAPAQEFGAARARMRLALAEHLAAQDVEPTGPYYVRYLGFGPGTVDFECGVFVAAKIAEGEHVGPAILPAGEVLTAWHAGSFDELPLLYGRLEQELAQRGLERASGHWELFWVDQISDPDPAGWRTQIVIPVQPATQDEAPGEGG